MKSSSYTPAQRKTVEAKRGDHCLQADSFPILIARAPMELKIMATILDETGADSGGILMGVARRSG
jgi:hypothetical protein